MGDNVGDAHFQKRTKWTPEEMKILHDEVDRDISNNVPNRKFCLELIRQHPFVFVNKTKIQVQDKFRRIIRKRQSL